MLSYLNGLVGMTQTGVAYVRPSVFCFKAARESRHKNSKQYKWKLAVCSGLVQWTRLFKLYGKRNLCRSSGLTIEVKKNQPLLLKEFNFDSGLLNTRVK